jgi:hypothetical protein
MEILIGSPGRLTEVSNGLTPEQLRAVPEEGGWSARDVVAHLKSCSDMWGGQIQLMLKEDNPTFKAVNPRTWIKQTDYLERDFQPLLDAFIAQRNELLEVLVSLTPEQWLRKGKAFGWGQYYDRQVLREADALARHERTHIKQIDGILGSIAGE